MSKLDQCNYEEMIFEVNAVRVHLHEWAEQLDEHASSEGNAAWDAYRQAEVAYQRLIDARNENAKRWEKDIEQSLKRVELGTTTAKDAHILREAMK